MRLSSNLRPGNMNRLRQIGYVLVKHGLLNIVAKLGFYKDQLLPSDNIKKDRKLRKQIPDPVHMRQSMEELGPTFIKLGQLLATRSDMFPEHYICEFKKLQDSVPTFSYAEVSKQIEIELGHPPEEIFQSFEKEAVAAASISQVHRAVLKTGEKVAVKLQRPKIIQTIRQDIGIMYYLANLIERNFEGGELLNPKAIVDEFENTIFKELDFVTEASNIERFKHNFESMPEIYVPSVYWEYTTKRVLVIELIEGFPVDQPDVLIAQGMDIKEIAETGLRCFAKQVMEDGFFHGDPHAGNGMVKPDGRLAIIDFGIIGYLSPDMMQNLAQLLVAFSAHDYQAVTEAFSEMGIFDKSLDLVDLQHDIQDVSEPYYGRPLKHISIQEIFEQISRVCRKHRIKLPRDLLLLLKAFSQNEATGRSLNSETSILETTKPYAKRLLDRQFEAKSLFNDAQHDFTRHFKAMRETPYTLHKLLNQLATGKHRLEVHHSGFDSVEKDLGKGVNRLTFGLIISAALIASSLVMTSTNEIATVDIPSMGIQNISITTILGMIGYTAATTLGLWLVLSMYRSGKM